MKRLLKSNWLWAAAIFLVVFAVYLFTLRPAVWFSDQGEFATWPAFLAVGHYPGYPLLTQLYFLPHLAGIASAAAPSLLNALFGALAAAALFGAWRALEVRKAAAAALALAFAVTPAAWSWATGGPDAHTLDALCAALVLWLSASALKRGDGRLFAAAAFVFGLALGNRVTFVLLAPWLLAAGILLPRRPGWLALAAFALGVSVYLYLPFRRGAFGPMYLPPPLINADTVYGWVLRPPHVAPEAGRVWWRYIPANVIFQAKYGILAFAAWGVFALARRRPGGGVMAAALGVALAAFLTVFAAYAGGPADAYMLLPLLLLATFAALGADALSGWVGKRRWAAALVAAAAFALPLYGAWKAFPLANHRPETTAAANTMEALRGMPFESAALGDHTAFTPYVHLRFAQKRRLDIALAAVSAAEWRGAPARLAAGSLTLLGPRGCPDSAWRRRNAVYFVTTYPGTACNPEYRWIFLPASFLGRRLAALPEGGRFLAAMADAYPLDVKNDLRAGRWTPRNLQYKRPYINMSRRPGAAVILRGERRGGVWSINALAGFGAGAVNLPRERLAYRCRGDDHYGMDSFELQWPGGRYRAAAAGILFIPLTAAGAAAGPPQFHPIGRWDPFILRVAAGGGPPEWYEK